MQSQINSQLKNKNHSDDINNEVLSKCTGNTKSLGDILLTNKNKKSGISISVRGIPHDTSTGTLKPFGSAWKPNSTTQILYENDDIKNDKCPDEAFPDLNLSAISAKNINPNEKTRNNSLMNQKSHTNISSRRNQVNIFDTSQSQLKSSKVQFLADEYKKKSNIEQTPTQFPKGPFKTFDNQNGPLDINIVNNNISTKRNTSNNIINNYNDEKNISAKPKPDNNIDLSVIRNSAVGAAETKNYDLSNKLIQKKDHSTEQKSSNIKPSYNKSNNINLGRLFLRNNCLSNREPRSLVDDDQTKDNYLEAKSKINRNSSPKTNRNFRKNLNDIIIETLNPKILNNTLESKKSQSTSNESVKSSSIRSEKDIITKLNNKVVPSSVKSTDSKSNLLKEFITSIDYESPNHIKKDDNVDKYIFSMKLENKLNNISEKLELTPTSKQKLNTTDQTKESSLNKIAHLSQHNNTHKFRSTQREEIDKNSYKDKRYVYLNTNEPEFNVPEEKLLSSNNVAIKMNESWKQVDLSNQNMKYEWIANDDSKLYDNYKTKKTTKENNKSKLQPNKINEILKVDKLIDTNSNQVINQQNHVENSFKIDREKSSNNMSAKSTTGSKYQYFNNRTGQKKYTTRNYRNNDTIENNKTNYAKSKYDTKSVQYEKRNYRLQGCNRKQRINSETEYSKYGIVNHSNRLLKNIWMPKDSEDTTTNSCVPDNVNLSQNKPIKTKKKSSQNRQKSVGINVFSKQVDLNKNEIKDCTGTSIDSNLFDCNNGIIPCSPNSLWDYFQSTSRVDPDIAAIWDRDLQILPKSNSNRYVTNKDIISIDEKYSGDNSQQGYHEMSIHKDKPIFSSPKTIDYSKQAIPPLFVIAPPIGSDSKDDLSK